MAVFGLWRKPISVDEAPQYKKTEPRLRDPRAPNPDTADILLLWPDLAPHMRNDGGLKLGEVWEVGNRLARYLHENEISNIVFIDRAARPVYIPMRLAWQGIYPKERLPGIYFVQPRGFATDRCEPPRTTEEVLESFRRLHPFLAAQSENPVMIFDICVHSNRSYIGVFNTLQAAGFKSIRRGQLQPTNSEWMGDEGTRPEAQFVALNRKVGMNCVPFGTFYGEPGREVADYWVISQRRDFDCPSDMPMKARKLIPKAFENHLLR